ncbi:hypothetical protein CPT_Moabite_169 [Serratia phage Moabite]|uniref:Uncharacterized protein n=3 Tax=Moabitevirus TaxID=2843422 RepID=A0A7T3NBQ2_9CAUD|nr:hypothetical protein HWC48_gp247 [Serratia phage Moabite]QPX76655.1 hypothetical protein [Serratia phage vB_SmaM_Yaphecito]UCR74698.1 hypothetical protein [Serratia phage BUCT660]UGO54054.1 hypothetical protein HAYMO_72 [Serratia phage vB_SmaM_Haymo]UQT03563.1 hypothetical protein KODAMA_00960 [Serratia phage vB_SmaM-Kodama]URG14266.1 hypothetical protein [Pectobacterium phage vB_ParM-25]
MRPGLPLRFRTAEETHRISDHEYSGPMNLLALMFRKVKGDLAINSAMWSNLMNRYLKDPRNEVTQTSRGRSSERSNLNRGLTHPEMSIKVFIKGLRVLNPKHLKFTILLVHLDGSKTSHKVEMDPEDLYQHYHNEKYPTRLNVLHQLFLDIRKTVTPTEEDWNRAMKSYLEDPGNDFDDKNKLRSSERSNVNRGLNNPDMSSKIFTKGLKVINPAQIYFTLELEFPGEQITHHEVRMEGNHLYIAGGDEQDD